MYLMAVVLLAVGVAVVVQAVPQTGGGGLGVRVEVKVVLEVREQVDRSGLVDVV